MERARVSVSLKAPERGNAGLLREFRRGFLQTAICSARADLLAVGHRREIYRL